jgi:hypothetical protein
MSLAVQWGDVPTSTGIRRSILNSLTGQNQYQLNTLSIIQQLIGHYILLVPIMPTAS